MEKLRSEIKNFDLLCGKEIFSQLVLKKKTIFLRLPNTEEKLYFVLDVVKFFFITKTRLSKQTLIEVSVVRECMSGFHPPWMQLALASSSKLYLQSGSTTVWFFP